MRENSVCLCSDEAKINCSFEEGFCFWRHDADDDGDWLRKNGSSLPSLTGPSVDHTLANLSGKLHFCAQAKTVSFRFCHLNAVHHDAA